MTNGSISWRDLHALERDTLVEVARVAGLHKQASRAEIHPPLGEYVYENVSRGQVYGVLESLEAENIVEKDEAGGSSDWSPTGTGRSVMQWYAEEVASQIDLVGPGKATAQHAFERLKLIRALNIEQILECVVAAWREDQILDDGCVSTSKSLEIAIAFVSLDLVEATDLRLDGFRIE